MSVNIDGMFLCTKAVGAVMLAAGKGGSIVNIASMSGFIGNRGRKNSAYCTSKGAVVMFTRDAMTRKHEQGRRWWHEGRDPVASTAATRAVRWRQKRESQPGRRP